MIEIVESTMRHCKELSETLREEDKKEAIALGHDPRRAVFFAYRHGIHRRTALVDGHVGAMWGLVGSLIGQTAQPYLMTGTEALRVSPLLFSRIYRNEVRTMKDLFPNLENYVDYRYQGAVRMLRIAGFRLTGPHYIGDNKNMFLKFSMTSEA